ncbi:hypothetical protein GGX14DRAFT_628736 [Mycena pura]|uniref:Tail specific protease domain-containing protein n=1 Tax=Mycena pura TaxID=153505 RepID=A0AAD7E3V8_9AGAR|nr:hypothetical protein GGX14DRAFT_628736 [Mycena pura]
MIHPLLLLVFAAPIVHAATDPCTLATESTWVSSKVAHACELNVPFNKTRSLLVIDSVIRSLPYYSLENWFLHSPNPQIPHDVNIRALLESMCLAFTGPDFNLVKVFKARPQQLGTRRTGISTWLQVLVAILHGIENDIILQITNAYDKEADGHTLYVADCTEAFSWNLPFSIATLAQNPDDTTAFPTFLVNYDFPNQGRDGLEEYYESIDVHVRQFDGARILKIDGVEASTYLVDLATESSIFDGLVGSFETVEPRYMRLMSRYSADTVSGFFTQEVGRFGQRAFYPGADSVTVTLQLAYGGPQTLTIPWAATFAGSGSDTPSFIAETCLALEIQALENTGFDAKKRKAVIAPEAQESVRKAASRHNVVANGSNAVQPTLKSFGHFVTLDIYQLEEHPTVGVVYFQQFEPQDTTAANDYFTGISDTLFSGLTALKAAGVERILIDNSGNRGGFIFAGAIALWSLWPQDLYPGFPAVFRESDLIRRQSDQAASTMNQNSEYFYGFYRDLNYVLLQNNSQFMNPPVPQVVNGVPDTFSHQFFDDFGVNSSVVTNFTTPPFQGQDVVLVANGICASTCSIFSSYLFQKHGVRSAVFGGTPQAKISQFDGGVKGSEVTDYASILAELQTTGLQDDPEAPQPLPIAATGFTMNFRNAIPYIDKQDGILDYVFEPDTKKYQFTHDQYNRPQKIWEFVAQEFWGT